MPSLNRDSDRALDAALRAARPEPSPEITRAIADGVRPRRTAGTHRFARVHLALAGGLTALVLTPVVAMGFGGLGSIVKHKTKHNAALVSKAKKGKALGALTTRSRALSSLARLGGTSSAAALAPAGGSFVGDIFAAQNDFQATQDEYAQVCDIDALIQDNDATLTQGGNTATGGNATSTGGAGGNANTGNTQTNTGGAGGGTQSFGGDTTATSGNATGGNGGNGSATGGDAVATNTASQTLINVACIPTP